MKVYAGLDPGKNGAIAAIFVDKGKVSKIETHVMPMLNSDEYDLQGLRDIIETLSKLDTHFVIENVHSIFGTSAKSNFQFGMGVGIVRTSIAFFQIPFTLVQSKTWQKVCFEGVKEIRKPGKAKEGRGSVDTKAMALIAVKRLYPKVNLLATARSKVPHDGLVDALLMSHFCKLNF
jgi:hypothetical protein